MVPKTVQETYKQVALLNPFPGLRPFGIEESHLFFGREGQSETVLNYLIETRFAAVTGASGSGKSSLIYCGLIPLLHGGFIAEAGSDWKIIAVRPGNSPVENLAAALTENEVGRNYSENGHFKKQINYSVLRRSSFGLVDAIMQMKIPQGTNILLIIDQFEELFRFKESRKDTTTLNETEAYIKLIVNAVNQKDLPIYAVLTMRSDFIGECSQFQDLTKLINSSNFLIPQMTREDFRQAILGPVSVGNAKIDSQLVQHILNTIENKSDQLPILQHAMMRTWDFWARYNEPNIPLSMRDYESAGKMENALSKHANEAYEELTEKEKQICKSMFMTLTEKGPDNKGIRHPARIKDIAVIAQVPDQEVIAVADRFRGSGRSFLTPPEKTRLDENTIIDISHESLMRIWDKLKTWVDEEAASVQMYLRLAEAATLFQLGKAGLWRPPDLQLAINWKKTNKPTLTWARKYNPAFEKVMVFLDASEKKHIQDEQNKVRLQRRALNRTKKFAMIMGIVSILFLGLMFYANTQRVEAEKQKKMADELRYVAEGQKDKAVYQSQQKELERLKAVLAADSAEQAKINALVQSKIATREKDQAIEEAQQVTQKSAEIVKTTQQEKQQAELTAIQAKKSQTEAEKQKEQALAKRMLSIAQSMAIKSTQENDDKNLKALLAYQAYLFNKQYGGQINNPDMYSGLYAALVALNGNNYNAYIAHDGSVRSVAFLPGTSEFYSAGSDGKILHWDLLHSSKSYQTLINNNFINRSLAISPNGRWLACGTGTSTIQLFNLNNPNTAPTILEGHRGWVGSLVFTPDNKGLISTSTDKTVIYWDLQSGNKKLLFENDTKINSICVSPNGKYLVGGTDDGIVFRWDLINQSKDILYQSNNNTIYVVTYNRSGNMIAFGDKLGNLRVLNPSTLKLIINIKAHEARILDIKFRPDNQQIATSSYDGTIKLWNLRNMNDRPIAITEHESWVLSVDYSSDGKYLVSSSQKGVIFVWPTSVDDMAENMCAKITRNMTTQEWETYVGYDIDYQKTCPNLSN